MTLMRAAPGPQLSAGRLRVDAAKAIAKLREYQLVDRTAWILEAIRGAVAGGATKIDLRGDANDVWLSWEGPAWPVADLPRLFDELVSPEPLEERQHLRLLAAAVNSALGMNPAYVDVYTTGVGDEHGPRRARYTPDVLDETEQLEDSPLRQVKAVAAALPADAAAGCSMVVHLRRRVAVGMLTYLFWEREPPEIATARAACRDIAVPLTAGGVELHREIVRHDLERIPLGDDLDGFIALVDPAAPRPAHLEATLEVAERGVVLAVYPLAIGPLGGPPVEGFELRGPVPVRVFLDAKRMPTNASRSQVRREVHPISTAQTRSAELAKKLIANLAAAARQEDANDRTRATALALIAAAIAGPGWSSITATRLLGPLAEVPLFRDTGGTVRPISHSWDGLVYTGRSPLDEALVKWVPGMMWVPRGDPAAKLIAGTVIDEIQARVKIKRAKAQLRAHRKFFGHAERPPTLAPQPRMPRVTAALGAALPGSCIPDSLFGGMKGEVGLTLDRLGGELTLMYRGRPIERVDDLDVPFGFVATIDCGQLTPAEDYNSAKRDMSFDRVERALRGALVRAAEVVAIELDGKDPPPGWAVGPHGPYDVEARVARTALGLAHHMGVLYGGTLLHDAKVWGTCDGSWISFRDLCGHDVIGFSTGVLGLAPPHGRLMLPGGKQLIAQLLPKTRLVDYDFREIVERAERPELLARRLADKHGFALEIHGKKADDLCGAIAPVHAGSKVRLHHVGVELADREYKPTMVFGAAVCVDSDAIVPEESWHRLAADPDDAGGRSYSDWERALLVAAARTLAGERPPELHGPHVVGLDNELARMLLHAVAQPKNNRLADLDADVMKRLRAAPLVNVLGERELISIDEVAKRFPRSIPYVDKLARPVDGYAPIVADTVTAVGIGMLAGVSIVDGSEALELRRRTVVRARNLEKHRAQTALSLAFPAHAGLHVPLVDTHVKVKGVVGVHRHQVEIQIRVEGRPFKTLSNSSELPLLAIVDLDLSYTNSQFEDIAPMVESQLLDAVRKTAGPLLVEIAKSRPEELAVLGNTRSLLAMYVTRERGNMPTDVRVALMKAPAFMTLQGTRTSLNDASHPRNALRIARFQGDWVECGAGESPSALDEGVLVAPEPHGELDELIRQLFHGSIVDVSDEVGKLQARRRMERGLIPPPTLANVAAELKRPVRSLGAFGKSLGLGEIGLVPGARSNLHIYIEGQMKRTMALDVLPAIELALESPDLGKIEQQAQLLAVVLVGEILGPNRDKPLPPRIASSVRRALLSKRIEADAVRTPVFELASGGWVPIQTVRDQIEKYGNAWALPEANVLLRPLDENRLVFVLGADELKLANFAIIDATKELELDDRARKNRNKPKAKRLEIEGRDDYLLVKVELAGDGVTAPRGMVGALMPHAADQRGLYMHREMHPFEQSEDPCRWPAIAYVDDARLEPDRTWQRPKYPQPALSEVGSRVSAAIERGLAQLVPKPSGAFAHMHVGPSTALGKEAIKSKIQVRGAVSLVGAPRPPQPAIEVFDAYGKHAYVPRRPLGMTGKLWVYARDGWNRGVVLDEMLGELYAALVKQLIGAKDLDADLVSAHVASAVLQGLIPPGDARGTKFECFRPRAFNGFDLHGIRDRWEYRVFDPTDLADNIDALDPNGDAGVIDDGSETAQVVIAHLGARAKRGPIHKPAPPPPPPPAPPRPAPPSPVARPPKSLITPIVFPSLPILAPIDHAKAPDPPTPEPPRPEPPKPRPKEPEPPHAIQNVVDAVYRRLVDLGIPTFGVRVTDVASPIARYRDGVLSFAGRDNRLHAVANAMRANSPWAPLAIDAVIAHAITVLNEARTEVTDDTERHVLKTLLTR